MIEPNALKKNPLLMAGVGYRKLWFSFKLVLNKVAGMNWWFRTLGRNSSKANIAGVITQ